VHEYPDRKLGGNNYGLKNPGSLTILDDPPAVLIPDPIEEDDMPTNGYMTADEEERRAEMTDALETARAAKKFLKAVGGPEQAKKCLEAYPEQTPVTQWVEVLSD
jgi:hypothetical protein